MAVFGGQCRRHHRLQGNSAVLPLTSTPRAHAHAHSTMSYGYNPQVGSTCSLSVYVADEPRLLLLSFLCCCVTPILATSRTVDYCACSPFIDWKPVWLLHDTVRLTRTSWSQRGRIRRATAASRTTRRRRPPVCVVHFTVSPLILFRARLWAWFNSVDTDRSGNISAPELQQALVNGDWSRKPPFPALSTLSQGLFAAFDLVRRSVIATTRTHACAQDTVKLLMTIFDTDRSGTVTFNEFVGLWKYIQEWQGCVLSAICPACPGADTSKASSATSTGFVSLLARARQRSLTHMQDRSGSIDGRELAAALEAFNFRLSPQALQLVERKYCESRYRRARPLPPAHPRDSYALSEPSLCTGARRLRTRRHHVRQVRAAHPQRRARQLNELFCADSCAVASWSSSCRKASLASRTADSTSS